MKIIFGAIVTGGSGKIGGQFIKRTKNGHSFNNLMNSKSKNYLRNFPQLSFLSFIIRSWLNVPALTKSAWQDLADINPVLDKYGNSKILSGRQFYIKVQSQGWRYNGALISIESFSNIIGNVTWEFLGSNLEANEVIFTGVLHSDVAQYNLRVDKVNSKAVTPFYRNSKNIVVLNLSDTADINIYSYIWSKYPALKVGDVYNISFQATNEFGWNGTFQSFVITLS